MQEWLPCSCPHPFVLCAWRLALEEESVTGQDPIQALWIGEKLSHLEQLSLASFVANGHEVHLYAYEDIAGVPPGVSVIDGRGVLPEDAIFSFGPDAAFGAGSFAAFANLFRYKLLYEKGGWWIDVDMVCLRHFDIEAPYVFGYEHGTSINCAVLRLQQGSPVAESLYQAALAKGTDLNWGDTGARLFSEKVAEFHLEGFALPTSAFYPVHAWAADTLLQEDPDGSRIARLEGAYGVHFWNSILNWAGRDKNAEYPASSIYEQLKARFGVGQPAKEREG